MTQNKVNSIKASALSLLNAALAEKINNNAPNKTTNYIKFFSLKISKYQ